MDRLYVDTNVLFPMTLMDLMLSMAEDFHHDILWVKKEPSSCSPLDRPILFGVCNLPPAGWANS